MFTNQSADLAGWTLMAIMVAVSTANLVYLILLHRRISAATKAIQTLLASHKTWLDIGGMLIDKFPQIIEGGSRLLVGAQELYRLVQLGGGFRSHMRKEDSDKPTRR